MVSKTETVGRAASGFFNNPSVFALAAIGIGLFLFRDKISNFFSQITGGVEGAAEIGETAGILNENFQGFLTGVQDLTSGKFLEGFEFPEIKLPDFNFPSSETFFGDLQNQFTNFLGNIIPTVDAVPEIDSSSQDAIDKAIQTQGDVFSTEKIVPVDFNPERTTSIFGTEIVVPKGNEFEIGGGLSFIGGSTTFGDNLVDTLSEVLNIFPSLTASQARDALEENTGLSASQFRLIDPDVRNISNLEEENVIFRNSSGGFTGLTPEQIFKLISGL